MKFFLLLLFLEINNKILERNNIRIYYVNCIFKTSFLDCAEALTFSDKLKFEGNKNVLLIIIAI